MEIKKQTNMKKSQSEIKNTLTKMKDALQEINK